MQLYQGYSLVNLRCSLKFCGSKALFDFTLSSGTIGSQFGIDYMDYYEFDSLYHLQRGRRYYEGTNHLGNVLVVFTDKRLAQCAADTVQRYRADVVQAQHYYAFGAMMPGLTFTPSRAYRFGFNGKENDNEVKGTGNQQDYGMRVYDNRLGRFLSIDPLSYKYAFWTPYQFAGNKPIMFIDLDGLENAIPYIQKFKYGNNLLLNAVNVVDNAVIEVANGIIGLANSSIYAGQVLSSSGGFQRAGNEIQSEFAATFEGTKAYLIDQYKYATETPLSVQAKETLNGLTFAQNWEQSFAVGITLFFPEFKRITLPEITAQSVKIIPIAEKSVYREGYHFRKHGREMGYASKKEYREAAIEFAKKNQKNPDATILEGVWQGSGQKGNVQRAVQFDNKTVIIDKKTGEIIDFYDGTGVGQNFQQQRVLQQGKPSVPTQPMVQPQSTN